jgi:electron transfer flavoprotein beta subunit
MKIIVCVKQVPDTTEVRIDPKTNTLIREGVPSIINPDDMNAIEAALTLKDNNPGSTVTLVCMGPPQAEVALREGLAMGCDEAILVTDRAFGGSDTWATSNVLSHAVAELEYDIVLCGRQAIDGDTAQVGPQIAERLNLPQVTYVADIKQDGDTLTVQRNLEDGYQIVEVKMPCMLTCIKELNTPRYPSMGGIYDAYKKEIVYFTNEKLNVDPTLCGLKSSPTKVNKTFTPPAKDPGILIPEANEQTVSQVYQALKEKHYL